MELFTSSLKFNRVSNKCATAQRNKASEKGGTLHTGGLITVHEHVIRMSQELGRVFHFDEVFVQTHVRKGTSQFVDEWSWRTHEEFSTRLSQVRSEHESSPSADNENNDEDDIRRTQCWFDVIGGKKGDECTMQDNLLQITRQEEFHFIVPPTQLRPSPSPVVAKQPTLVQPTPV
ncbi:hypothetical protein LR48_Vigan11g059500 [Vigna angularis]|uniref:Uncharacterized protein n=1 Tax=Phaseolus angularis TaxID=3914 RepID=A0A0L9VRS4_PHAAN|nr:hypothetical protein LR48_Vigan11g059500 [Vigna angularis]